MASLDTFVGKYIRLTEDLHEMRAYLNDIRICFVALTVSCYVAILLYAFLLCARRRAGETDDSSLATSRVSRLRPTHHSQTRRSASRLDDGESGNANEWDDMMPAPPNGQAVKTVDGYRYRNPTRGGTKPPFHSPNRLSVNTDSLEMAGKRHQLVVDNHAGAALTGSPPGQARRSPSENAFRDGFMEKSPSIT